jgi:hypothetical protein
VLNFFRGHKQQKCFKNELILNKGFVWLLCLIKKVNKVMLPEYQYEGSGLRSIQTQTTHASIQPNLPDLNPARIVNRIGVSML